jgi:uncharacterized protein (DUF1501 family)
MRLTRREFLSQTGSCIGYALGASAFAAGVHRFGIINALAQGGDYRALVCVFLAGGNDGNNLVVPTTTTEYNAYASARSAAGLAIPRDSLLPVVPMSLGSTFGLHPSLGELQTLWLDQKAALVCNVGPLVQPLTRTDYLGGASRPNQLFSHSDQIAEWQTAIADRVGPTGWGGRIADRFDPAPSGFPMITALSGGTFTRGQTTAPLSIPSAPTALNQVLVLNGFGKTPDEVARRTAMDALRGMDIKFSLVASASRTTQQALDIGQTLNSDVTIATVFPNTTLGNQLKQVTDPPDLLLSAWRLRHASESGRHASESPHPDESGNQGVLRRDDRTRARSQRHDVRAVGLQPHVSAGRLGLRSGRQRPRMGQSSLRRRRRGSRSRLLRHPGTERDGVPGPPVGRTV